VQPPGRLVAEKASFRYGRGDFCHEGNVVGGVPVSRGKTRGRKGVVPGLVDENPVEADKSGSGPLVRPGVLAAAKGELKEPKGINHVIKKLYLRGREVSIISI
jgi:hypothetical protein